MTEWTVTEWTVTEWTESKNWTESTEAYEAKRSASKNWTESTETYEAKRSALVWRKTDRVVLATPTEPIEVRAVDRGTSGQGRRDARAAGPFGSGTDPAASCRSAVWEGLFA